MKISKWVKILLLVLVLIVGGNYIRLSLKKAAAPPEVGQAPSLDSAPARLYGVVEPRCREAFVGPLVSRRVIAIKVKEGEQIKKGDAILRLDDDIEREALRMAESRVEEARHNLELTLYELRRKRELARKKAVPQFEVTRLELQTALDEQMIATAMAEARLRRREIEKLTLRSPIDGIIYKLDIRLGEQLTPQDYPRIVVGTLEKQVRLFVESFWRGQVMPGQRFRVLEAETLREIGTGTLESLSPYVGARDFRTEDPLERHDVKYTQAILTADGLKEVPIGLMVICEREDRKGQEKDS